MSDSENESYHSDSEQENDFEESDYSDGEESLDPEQELRSSHIKIGSKIDADLGGESDEEEEDEDEVELGINELMKKRKKKTASHIPFGPQSMKKRSRR